MTIPFAPADDTRTAAPKPPKAPTLPQRVLSPTEFDQARGLSSQGITETKFPPAAPTFTPPAAAPRESTHTGAADPNPGAKPLTGLARILTQYVAEPILEHPLLTGAMLASQPIPYVGAAVDVAFSGMMAKDLAEYSAQKFAEESFDKQTKAALEADPARISGEQAAVEAGMLGAAPLVHGMVKVGRGAMDAARAAENARPPLLREATVSEPTGLITPEQIAARDRTDVEPTEAANRRFPASEQTVTDYAAQKGLTPDEARTRLAAAGYDVPGATGEYLPGWDVATMGPKPTRAQYDAFQAKATETLAQHLPANRGPEGAARAALEAPDPAQTKKLSFATRLHMEGVRDAWLNIFAPASKTEQSLAAANILRASTGEAAGAYEAAAFQLDDFRRAIEPLPDADKLGFIDAIEGGRSQAAPEFQEAADVIRKTLDDTREQIRALGTGKLEHFIEDYFPHIWEDPEKAGQAFRSAAARRPLEGGKAFLKERSIPTTLEGIRLGLKPVSMNPVDLTMLKLREMQRYLLAHSALQEMKDAELVQLVRAGEKPPEGYAQINDKIATVLGPREGAVNLPEGAVKAVAFDKGGIVQAEPLRPEDVGVQGTRIMGQYWAPEAVARVVNNHLSPGLRGNALYDAYRALGNALNQAQLGLSAFHLGFTSMDATVSRAALGIEYIASGKPLTGLGELVSAPAAPITNAMKGAKIRHAYLNPESATPDMVALANAVKEAGGRVTMDSFYKNSAPDRLSAALKEGNVGKAALLSIPALLEQISKPIMEHIVPMQKLGIFGDLATKILEELPADATLADRRAALAKAWDSVDNRMGQVVYDNLFWNRTFKDLSMASVRSVGWNLGTIRELGGGMTDIAKMVSGGSTELSHSAAYVMALPIVVGLYGAAYQLLRTGQGPTELKDYFHPKTGETDPDGNPERVQLPSYMKDMFAYAGHPWTTIEHKVSPAIATVFEMLQNEDYYGDQIRNVDDPVVQQLQQEASFVAKTALPFAIRNMMESSARSDQSFASKAQSFVGITPASREDVRSDAQNQMAKYLAERKQSGATPEDADARQSRSELLMALRDNTEGQRSTQITEAVNNAIERHQLAPKQVVDLLKRAGSTPAQERYKRLTLEQALDVFHRSTPREQSLFAELLLKKVDNAIKSGRALPRGAEPAAIGAGPARIADVGGASASSLGSRTPRVASTALQHPNPYIDSRPPR